MIERFNLWEYSGLDHPGTIEATKSVHHGFGDAVKHIGKVELDIKEIKWCSNGLPLFPLKIFGGLERLCAGKPGSSKRAIHLVRINDLPFGYLVREGDGLQYEAGDLVLNGRRRIPLIASERRILHSMGLFKPDDELVVIYGGVRGEVKGHYSTLKPKDATKYCFSNVCIRDYVSC